MAYGTGILVTLNQLMGQQSEKRLCVFYHIDNQFFEVLLYFKIS